LNYVAPDNFYSESTVSKCLLGTKEQGVSGGKVLLRCQDQEAFFWELEASGVSFRERLLWIERQRVSSKN
jgi:hypothetical protein